MFDVSWGELTIVIGLGLALIGRKDLPQAARFAGTQVGRVVGLLQGARARADRFAANNELQQLQNELRAGLRELDAVRSELAVSMSGRGVMGRGLGPLTPNANRINAAPITAPATGQMSAFNQETSSDSVHSATIDSDSPFAYSPSMDRRIPLAPERQTIGAVAEEEWEKQGIAFRSRAEQGVGLSNYDQSTSGSVLLSNLMKQSLIFDQYDRVVQQQDDVLQSKIDQIRDQHVQSKASKE